MAQAKRDENRVPTLIGVSSVDLVTPTLIKVNPVTGALLVTGGGGGSGTVTDVSVVSANGFAGTVATSTTTPAITLSTTITGVLQGNGTAISAATTTGSGDVVLATSPTLVTPVIGVASGTSLSVSGILRSQTSLVLEETGAGTDIITIQSPSSIAASYTLTLPVDDGTSGQFLQTDGGGILSWQAGNSGTVTAVTGTSNRITSSGGATPAIDIAATYIGQSSITTLGTIGSGVWNGTAIVGQYGGTGVANTGKTITVSGNTTIGSSTDTVAFVTGGNTSVTLPTTGTLATLAGSEVFTNKTLTSPKIGTAILDTNGNEIIITPATASAVNEITVTNAATTTMPSITATGGDSVIALKITGKSAFVAASGEFSNGSSGSSKAIDWRNGDRQLLTVTASTTLTYSNALAGQTIILRIVEDGTGNFTIALPTSKWPGGVAGTFTTTPNAINLLTVYYDGTNYLTQLAAGFA